VRLAEAVLQIDVEGYLASISTPTLILAPAASPVTSLADQFHMRQAIEGSEIEVFEGRDHFIYLDEGPRCTARIRKFLSHLPITDRA
jgi:pimeloyl-ACP methyl ester carboxylesterase